MFQFIKTCYKIYRAKDRAEADKIVRDYITNKK